MRGSLGVVCRIDPPGIYEVTISFLANGRADIFALGIPFVPSTFTSFLPLSIAASEVTLVGAIEDANTGRKVLTSLPLVHQSPASLLPQTVLFSSVSHSLSLRRFFPSATLVYIYADIEIRLVAAGLAFSKVDFASGGANYIAVEFIQVVPIPSPP